jgi:hypothetical protein
MSRTLAPRAKKLIVLLGVLAAAASAMAFDSYRVVVPTDVMKGDPDVYFSVTPLQGALPDLAPHNIIITFPSGITENPLANPPSGLDWSAVASWGLFASNSAAAGNTALTVTEALAADPIISTKYFNLQNVVRSFEIIPPGAFTGTTGIPFQITIRAKDGVGGAGAVVTGFNDDVIISALIGDVVVNGVGNIVSGSDFVNGEAVVDVMLRGTDLNTRTNRITVTAAINYFNLGLASGFVDLNMNPGVYDHVVMLFPGETLVPGNILITNGKTGTATAATANVAVNNVAVYLVDAFNNPVLSAPPGGITLDFVSLTHPATDTVPASQTISVGNNVVVINGGFSFIVGNVAHQLRVFDQGDATKNSVTSVFVNSGAANLISVGTVTTPRIPGQSFTLSARVVDGTPAANTVVSYPSGRPVTLTLTNCAGSAFNTGSLDANPSLAGVQTTVNFTNGVFTGPIVVYPRSLNACVKFDDGLGNFGESNSFQIIIGDQLRLHIVMPGQAFTPGQAPGNAPAVPTTRTAGDLISADVYVVDQGWNVVDNVTGGWSQDVVVVSLENSQLVPGYVDLTVASPLMPASGNHATPTGVRLRTAYPNGDAQLVARMSGMEGRSDVFTINPNSYNQIVFVTPGETLASGIQSSIEPDGKTGLPTDQAVNISIPVGVYLTDAYFNTIINPPLAGPSWPSLTFSTVAPVGAIASFPFANPFAMTTGAFNDQLVLGTIGANTLRVVDSSPSQKSVNQTINVTAGDVTRFIVTPNPASITADSIPLQSVGVPFNLTFKAFDQFDNIAKQFGGDAYLELWENGAPLSYGGTISPSTITFVAHPVTGGVVANTPVTITYAGQQLGSGADNLQVRVYITTPTMRQGFSAFFNVQEALDWEDIAVTLQGETLRPGLGAPYKTGTPTSVVAGNSVGVTVTAVDQYGNKVDRAGAAELTIPTAGIFANLGTPAQVSFAQGQGVGAIQIYTAGPSVLVASVTANGFSDSSPVTISVGSYAASTGKLVLLAPGETLIPGTTSPPGKDSSGILSVEANTALSFQLYACDRFYNIDTTYSGNNKSLSSDDDAVSLSNLTINSGSATITNTFLSGNLPNPSTVRVTATDDSNTLKTSDAYVPVTPGAVYAITVPTSTLVGANFNMTVDLIDPNTGLPKAGANNSIFIEALTSSGTAAAVPIGVAVATLNNGTVTFQQNYSYVETIKIRVTDSFNRLTESGFVDVVPNGLRYVVTLPQTPKTADELFSVTVGLYDTVQSNLPIRGLAYQHTFNVYVTTISGGGRAAGSTPLSAATFNNGLATFNFGYTKAETIIVNASGTLAGYPPISGFALMTVQPGAYVKLLALAPGEIHEPGVPSATGKGSSVPSTQAAGQGFAVTVSAVDQYWNVVSAYNSSAETITLSASDGSLIGRSPQMFLNGQTVFSGVQLRTPPLVTLTARDTSNASLAPQSVNIPLRGRTYVATVTSPAPHYTGTDVFLNVELRFFSGNNAGDLVTGGAPLNIYVEALTPTFQVLPSTQLYVSSPLMTDPSDGTSEATVRYQVAENIVLRFYDDDGWQGFTDTIHFVPTDVDYVATLPDQSRVGPPDMFTMTITPRDKLTLTTAKNWTEDVSLTPVSAVGDPVTGTLQVSTVTISGGAVTFQQAFSQSGVFSFSLFDGVRTNTSPTMTFLPGPLASLTTNLPATLDAGVIQTVDVTVLDAYANPISNQSASFSLSDASFGTLSSLTGVSNVAGVASTVFNTNSQKSGSGEFRVTAGGASLRQAFRLLGPPSTSLRVEGRGVEEDKGFAIKPGDPVYIDVAVASGTTLLSLTYSVDGDTSHVVNEFTLLPSGMYTYGPLEGLDEEGRHTIEYFGVTQTGNNTLHQETVKTSKTIFVSAVTSPEEGLVNYPNPFRAGRDLSFLEYTLSSDAGVRLTIYDMMGQRVFERSYSQGEEGGVSGFNRISWEGRNDDGVVVGNGGYVAVLEATNGTKLRRKIAVKK